MYKAGEIPEQLGQTQCLEKLNASFTGIQEFPDCIGQLSRLQVLELRSCNKLRYLPESIGNFTSLAHLYLWDIFEISFPDTVKNRKLEYLGLRCNIRLGRL